MPGRRQDQEQRLRGWPSVEFWENSREAGTGSGGPGGTSPTVRVGAKPAGLSAVNAGDQTLEGQGDGQEVPAIGHAGNQGPESLQAVLAGFP